jgi:hypothetical protein
MYARIGTACALLLLSLTLQAQPQIIDTYAGGGPNNMPALSVNLIPSAIRVDTSGNYYVASASRIFKVDRSGNLTAVAGNGTAGFSGDGGPATEAGLGYRVGVAVGSSGNLFFADSSNYRIRKVEAATSLRTTVAGNGTRGFSGDGGAATEASLGLPFGVALDGDGNLYIVDTANNRVRIVFYPTVDSDGDGIDDDVDACPFEDATGFDTDLDGCIDSPAGLVEIVGTLVSEDVIATEMEKSIGSKIDNANKSSDKENTCAAVRKLEALVNQVKAQSGKKVSSEAATFLLEYLNNLITQQLNSLAAGDSCP